jgi:hypothetical protein
MKEIVTKYFSYEHDSKPFLVFRAMFEKSKKWKNSLYFIDEEVFDIFIGKWVHRADTVHRAWVLGDVDLDDLSIAEAQKYFEELKPRRELLIWRANHVTDKNALVLNYPLGRWADQRQHFPYLQTVKDSNGDWIVEVCGPKFLKLQYTGIQRKQIEELGFNNPNGSKKPNFWKILPASTSSEELVDFFLKTLDSVFDLGQPDNFFTEFPVPEYFESYERYED